jgi:AcrR family transcriptional regulator
VLTHVNPGRRRAPLDAALLVLRRDGPAQLTMRNVAAEAGVTATALYRHFANKEQLLQAVHREVFAVFRGHLIAELGARSPADVLRLACDRYVGFALEHPNYYRYLFVEPHTVRIDRYPDDFRNGRSPTFRHLRDVVERCMAVGFLRARDATDAALTIYAHLHGLVLLHFAERFGGDDAVFRAFVQRSLDHLLDGLRAV